METNKEKVIKELRRVFCAPCTTANSCVGCLVDVAEEAVNASQQSVQPTIATAAIEDSPFETGIRRNAVVQSNRNSG